MTKIFHNPDALRESLVIAKPSDTQVTEAKRIKHRLDGWIGKNKNAIVAYVGKFGAGKSTTLNQVNRLYHQSRSKKPRPLWLNFEAWRYVDRQQLWDGFVIEVIDKIGGKKHHSSTAHKIDGYRGAYGWMYRNAAWVLPLSFAIAIWLSSSVWFRLYNNVDVLSLLAKALLKYAIPLILTLLAFVGLSAAFSMKAPMRRIYDLEDALEKSLRKLTAPLIVVAEDVDRAGDEGITFLETLRSYLEQPRFNSKPLKYPIILIAPQDVTYMSALNSDKIRGLERGIKIYDEALYFNSSAIRDADIRVLLQVARADDAYKFTLEETILNMVNQYRDQMSLRLVKFILREIEEFAEAQEVCDPSITFVLIQSRYIIHADSSRKTDTLLNLLSRRREGNISLSIDSAGLAPIYRKLAKIAGIDGSIYNCDVSYVDSLDAEIKAEQTGTLPNGSINIKLEINGRYLALLPS